MSNKTSQESSLESFNWNQLSLEELKSLQSKINKAINLKKNDLKSTESYHQSINSSSQKYEYKATLAQVFPSRLRNSFCEYQKCVFIISLGSKNFVEYKRG